MTPPKPKLSRREDSKINENVLSDVMLPARYWKKVMPKPDGCWEWTGATSISTSGTRYGVINVNHKTYGAHRIAWILRRGSVTLGLDLDHLCRNTLCVNPDHLEEVTHAVNTQRGMAGAWFKQVQENKTHCPYGHPYDEENTIKRPNGWRKCRECNKRECKERKAKKKIERLLKQDNVDLGV